MNRNKTKTGYWWIGGVALFLCAFLFLGALLPAAAEPSVSLDYGIDGMDTNASYSATELYQKLFGTSPTPAEGSYLESQGLTMHYNPLIPTSQIKTDYQSDTGTLSVTVSPYRYIAANGVEVLWLPTRAVIDGQEVTLTETDGVYVCKLTDHYRSEDFEMSVDYTWTVEIPESVVAELRTSAYTAGSTAIALRTEYEQALEAYRSAVAEYEAWQTYLEKKAAYDAYCTALAAYNASKEAYEQYLSAYDAYLTELDAYRQWQDYFDFLDDYREHFEEYSRYQTYLNAMNAVKEKLRLMDSLFLTDSHGWQMYASVMGDTVSTVISHKDELVDYLQCSEADVDLAGQATEQLRVLLREYAAIRKQKYATDYEKIAAKYNYYLEHYEELKLNFTDLYRSLNALFQNTFVERVLKSEGKRDHYLQFVGQLYVLSTCLDQNGNRNENWTIGGKRLQEVVEENQLLEDGDWNPHLTALPEYMEEVQYIEIIERPTVPQPLRQPEPPKTVAAPGTPPREVADPDAEGIPAERNEHPGDAPIAPDFDAVTSALMQEIDTGVLKPYTGKIAPTKLQFHNTVTRMVSIRNLKTVNFYNYDGTLLHQAMVSFGESLSYAVPTRENTPEYSYRALGWVTLEGTSVNLQSIETDLDLYPHYERTRRIYTVTWKVIGVDRDGDGLDDDFSSFWSYGSTPSPGHDVPISSYETEFYRYVFAGWDKPITSVTGDVTYIGTMQQIPKEFTVTWVLEDGNTRVDESYAYGTVPEYRGDLTVRSDSVLYTFIGWNKPLLPISGNVTYIAQYEKRPLAIGGANKTLEISYTENLMIVHAGSYASINANAAMTLASANEQPLRILWDDGNALELSAAQASRLCQVGCTRIVLQHLEENNVRICELHFYNSAGEELSFAEEIARWDLPTEVKNGCKAIFDLETENGIVRLDTESLSVLGGIRLHQFDSYPVVAEQSPLCNVMSLNKRVVVGETVSLKLSCLLGYEVSGAVVRTADGTELVVNDLSFVMPDSEVTVTLTVTEIRYHLRFLVDGVLWSEATYAYGETIVLPDTPTKADDPNYVYSFVGWGTVPAIACGTEKELCFEAVFSAATKDVDYDTGHNNNRLAEVILPIGLTIFVLLVVVVALILRRVFVKRNKHLRSAKAQQPEPNQHPAENTETTASEEQTTPPSDP